MAVTNQERVGKAMDLLRQGLAPFVEREVQEKVRVGHLGKQADRSVGCRGTAEADVGDLERRLPLHPRGQ